MCECYKIGGPFISFDPDCLEHGYEAQKKEERAYEISSRIDSAQDMDELKIIIKELLSLLLE